MLEHSAYNIVREYLHSNIPTDLFASDFSENYSNELYEILHTFMSHESVLDCKESIQKAFNEFFSPHHYKIDISLDEKIAISIVQKSIKDVANANRVIHNIATELSRRKKELDNCWVQDDVLIFNKSLMDAINVYTNGIAELSARELVKAAVRHQLKLKDRDAVFFLKNRVVVRVFLRLQEKQSIVVNRRYGGLPPEDLKNLELELFEDNIWNFIRPKIDELLGSELDFSKIGNDYFYENYISILQKVFIDRVKKVAPNEDSELVLNFANYLLRQQHHNIMVEFTKSIFKSVQKGSENAKKFLCFYDGEIALSAIYKPFKKPKFIDAQGVQLCCTDIILDLKRNSSIIKRIEEIEASLLKKQELFSKNGDEFDALNQELNKLKQKSLSLNERVEYLKRNSQTSEDIYAKTMYQYKNISKKFNESEKKAKECEDNYKKYEEELHTTEEKVSNLKTELDQSFLHYNSLIEMCAKTIYKQPQAILK